MGGTFTSLGALKAAIQKECEEALQEAMEKSYKDAKDNVGNFYAAPEGVYHRTGALRESPTMSVSGMHGELSLNEYSCAMKSHFRKSGNQMSGKWKSSYASLLAQCFV